MHLLGSDSPAQYRCSDVAIAGLFLGVDADVIAIDIRGRIFGYGGIQLKSDALLQFLLETLRRSSRDAGTET